MNNLFRPPVLYFVIALELWHTTFNWFSVVPVSGLSTVSPTPNSASVDTIHIIAGVQNSAGLLGWRSPTPNIASVDTIRSIAGVRNCRLVRLALAHIGSFVTL